MGKMKRKTKRKRVRLCVVAQYCGEEREDRR